jgi:hypothetical protein
VRIRAYLTAGELDPGRSGDGTGEGRGVVAGCEARPVEERDGTE